MKLLPAIVAGITVVAAAVNAFEWWAGPGIRSLPTDRIAYPDAKASGIVLLLSGTEGWSDREQTVSDALVAGGAVVVVPKRLTSPSSSMLLVTFPKRLRET